MEVFDVLSQIIDIGSGISSTAQNVCRVVGVVAGDFSQLRMSLETEMTNIDRQQLYYFASAEKEVQFQGKRTQEMFRNLSSRWQQISSELQMVVSLKRLDAWQLIEFKRRVEDHLSYGSSCESSYNIFRERFNDALNTAHDLYSSLQSAAQRAQAGARKTKIGGYSVSGAMGAGAVACGVAAFFTGGLSLIGTAVLGAGAAAAAAATKKHASQLERLASDFHRRMSNINESINRMNGLADRVEAARLMGLSAALGLEEQLASLRLESNKRTKLAELKRQVQRYQSEIAYLESHD